MEQSEVFNQHRPLLFSIAYRMLGSIMDAEDILQEAFLRWSGATWEQVQSPKAYLSAIVTRLAIDQLRSAKVKREVYVGEWLPEPLLGDYGAITLNDTTEMADSLSIAFLVLLESLSPVERAVFLLREIFDYEYSEIALIVDKSEASCRQMLHRARQHLASRRPRFAVASQQREQLTRQFMQTCANGDMQGLLNLLTEDIVLKSDGGGKVNAARNPIYGSEKVARFMLGIMSKAPQDFRARLAQVNGQLNIITYLGQTIQSVVELDIADGRIQAIHIILNPDKLQLELPSA